MGSMMLETDISWFRATMKYAAYFVVALNHDMSVSSIIDPIKKIEALLANR